VWRLLTHPGTFHALVQAVATAARGGGWTFDWPPGGWASEGGGGGGGGGGGSSRFLDATGQPSAAAAASDSSVTSGGGGKDDAAAAPDSGAADTYYGAHPDPYWDRYLSAERELAFFKRRAVDGGAEPGASAWERMMEKDLPGRLRYTAWRRTLPDGKTEYKSVTVAPDAQPEEVMDLFLDDGYRREWDPMVVQSQVLEHGPDFFARRQQVVRWVRRFPFAFLSDRQYAIARCVVREPAALWRPSARLTPDAAVASLDAPTRSRDVLYGLTRSVRHPREDRAGRVVRMDVFWSHWRSRGVPCPWGSGRTACETVLLHHEQFKIPENLARFAVRHGMWGFVRSLGEKTAQFVRARRERGVAPDARDPLAYGAGAAPDPPTPDEVARAEAEEAALAARGGGGGGSRAPSRQGSAQVPLPALASAGSGLASPPAPDVPSPPPRLMRAASAASSVAAADEAAAAAAAGAPGSPSSSASGGAAADPAFLSWAHSGPVVSRLRGALPSAPPGAVHIHHSLSNASVAGLATVPSMVWSKIAQAGSFGAGLAALASGGGGGGAAAAGGGGNDADGADSVVDFGAGDDLDDYADALSTRRGGGRDQGAGGAASPDAVVSVRPSGAGGGGAGGAGGSGRVVSFANGGGGNSGKGPQHHHQLRLASASLEAVQREQQQREQRARRRRAAAAVLAAGALALAVGGGGAGGLSLRGERRRPRPPGVVVAALPSPAEEQRRRRERQRQHRELRSYATEEQEQEEQERGRRRKASSPAPAAPSAPRSFPPLTSFPIG
jgi:hypothetical protein